MKAAFCLQFGEGNGVKWQRGGNGAGGAAAGGAGSNRRYPPHRHPQTAASPAATPVASPAATAQLLENGGVLEPHWRDGAPATPLVAAADAVPAEDGGQAAEDAVDGGSELVVMISPANRKPRVYAVGAVGKVSRKWPKALMLKMARKQAGGLAGGATEASVTATPPKAAKAPQLGETCI